ncbi:hypothetical protein RI054_10g52670 [Pseudoscourfieldia marina]
MADGDEQAAAEGTFEGEAANNAMTELERFEYTSLSGDVAALCASRRAEVSKATSSEAEQDFLLSLLVHEHCLVLPFVCPSTR